MVGLFFIPEKRPRLEFVSPENFAELAFSEKLEVGKQTTIVGKKRHNRTIANRKSRNEELNYSF